jgi:predicted AAA+ superfamily ATPase
MNKIYFFDLGLRNALINNFNSLNLRNDIGQLWENFLLTERRKKLSYELSFANTYFWRTYSGAELDYVEETGGKLHGYEFKFKPSKRKPPHTWLETYSEATFDYIHRENFFDFVL